ncbi:calmodulin-dependent protein kinase [Pelomyxa schiedti]|nr:calmodulin-dependent protein kinase [Pelomyxa schiedti]
MITMAFVLSPIDTRNEMMMDALFELQLGNVDSAIALVANASSLFESEMTRESCPKCEYLPGLLFLYCLRCVINDHVSLHQRIPPCLSLVFSRAISSTPEEMRATCMRVLSDTSRTSEQEWTDLVSAVSLRGNVDHQPPSSSTTAERSWSCMYFVAMWNLYCCRSANLQNGQCSASAAHIFVEMSAKIPAPGSSSDEHSNPSIVATCSASQINWCISAVTYLGICYKYGVGGVKKDVHKAATLLRRAVDACEVTAMCHLGLCYVVGDGVEKDIHKAVSLWQRAADAGHTTAMFNLGLCYERGDGVDQDTSKAVSLYQRAADVGYTSAICNLATCFYSGNGVEQVKAVTLYQTAADAGNATAMTGLGVCYYNGNGVEKDIHKAVTLWQGVADDGEADALCYLAVCYQNGAGVHRDASKAVTLLHRAADVGSANAMYILACRHSRGVGGLAKDIHQAHRLWRRAADMGHSKAAARLRNLLSKSNST